MQKTNIIIGDQDYIVLIANTEDQRKQGLMGIKHLPQNKGMLFIFDSVGTNEMWMKNTFIPLQQIFLNSNKEVIKTIERNPEDESLIGCEGTKYVLEVNPTDKIEIGDDMIIEDEEDDSQSPIMKVLAPDGSTQMELKGGERIFSRKNTKILIKQAKKAYQSKSDNDYKRLGKSVFKYLHIQDHRNPEYVVAPK